MFVLAIVLFVAGSLLCGAAQSMTQLIVFRGIQGLGAGGLIPLAQTAIGDLFSPRERGRYQGYIGSVWAAAAVAGPLVGGLLTDHASWRWIFYVNLPLGGLALAVVLVALNVPFERREHSIDYLGAATLSAAVTCLLLVAVWGGTTYAWGSAQIVGLAAGGIALLGVFTLVERSASEPVLPFSLFRDPIFSVACSAALLLGAAVFVAMIYIPLFVQGVIASSATSSGVVIMPLSFGWVAASMVTGRIITRTGRYRVFPIAGTVVAVAGFWLLTRLDAQSTNLETVVDMVVIGIGMGLTVQTYVVALQNAVPRSELGVATAANMFFRSMGGMFAVAAFGTVLTNRLAVELPAQLRAAAGTVTPQSLLREPDAAGRLPPHLVQGVHEALAASLHTVFVDMVPVVALALVLAFLLKEIPLRTAAHVHAAVAKPEPEVSGPA